MLRVVYTILIYLRIPLFLLRQFYRGRCHPGYRKHWNEYFALKKLTVAPAGSIWIHAESFGEVIAAAQLIRELCKDHSHLTIVVTTVNPASRAAIPEVCGTLVSYAHLPIDVPWFLRRFIRMIRPKLMVIMECAFRPNQIYVCDCEAVPIVGANAWISEKRFRKYKMLGLRNTTGILGRIRQLAATSEACAGRLRTLGCRNVMVSGNIKFDVVSPETVVAAGRKLRTHIGTDRPVWLAASVHLYELKIILATYAKIQSVFPKVLLILVPRAIQCFPYMRKSCTRTRWKVGQCSSQDVITSETHIHLVDVVGKLMQFFAASDVVFIGKTLRKQGGGQNLIEPAYVGVPIVAGPNFLNLEEVAQPFVDAGAIVQVQDADGLAQAVISLLQNPEKGKKLAALARQVALRNQGATEITFNMVSQYLPSLPRTNVPKQSPPVEHSHSPLVSL